VLDKSATRQLKAKKVILPKGDLNPLPGISLLKYAGLDGELSAPVRN
jgi:hypothetical protein